jgi:serine/threonine-protein kinase
VAIRRISHFEIEELLGEGAMGKVYRARDTVLDRPVAIKLLSDRTLGDPTFLERFQREARLAAQLNHPHIATIYAFGKEENGEAYIAMEFVEGETLAEVISRGPLPVPVVRKYGQQAASALAAAHSRGILHRDIKPANLMITAGGDLKIMDFGVARRAGDTQLTMAGSLVGTANIMAPEIIRGKEAGPAADMFSLGCVLYECLAGRPAFEGDDPMAVLYQVMNAEPAPLEEVRPEVPPYIRDLVHGLLQKNPLGRTGPAEWVVEALTEGEGGSGLDPTATLTLENGTGTLVLVPAGDGEGTAPVPGAPEPAEPLRRRAFRWYYGILPVLAIAVGVWYAFLRETGPSEADVAEAQRMVEEAVGLMTNTPPDVETAQVKLENAVALDERNAKAWNNLGATYRDSDPARAEECFLKASSLDDGYAQPLDNLAQLYMDQKKYSEARERLNQVLAIDPEFGPARVRLGDVHAELGEYEEAEDTYRKAMDSEDVFLPAVNNLGALLVEVDRCSDAVEELAFVERDPRVYPWLWKNYGLALSCVGDLDKAEEYLKRVPPDSPHYDAAQAGLTEIAQKRSGGN